VKRSFLYTICYSAILGAVCAVLLTAAASFTRPYREYNAKAEETLNILTALKVPIPVDASAEQLVEIFNTNVHEKDLKGRAFYEYLPVDSGAKIQAVAVRFSGRGLWGPIKGFLALEADIRTIRGITFYEQEETPGLGGEIISSKFREQFAGKSIIDETGKAGIIIQAGGSNLLNGVDAITGATMTCNKVQAMLNAVIENIITEKD
jgi:Na+-transporting NADH:ubiquinone oxidoreductase subunit C